MVHLYERAKHDAGYNPTYFVRMLSEHGGVETARRLVARDTPSGGFTQLYLKGHLDLTLAAAVLEPRFSHLFDGELLDQARRRLHQYGYDQPVRSGTSLARYALEPAEQDHF